MPTLTHSPNYSGASAIVTRHESTDLTLNASDQVTNVTVQGAKASGTADVKIDLLDTTGTILDTKTVSLSTASGSYSTNAAMTLGNIAYSNVAEVKVVYTAVGGGEIAIYREAVALDAITTANFDHDWDTTVREDTDSFGQAGANITLKSTGHYLVMYGARFDSSGGSNRSETQSQLRLAGADLPIGWSQGYIIRSNGYDEAFTAGGGIIDVATADDVLVLRSFRTDDNSAGVQRAPNTSGIQLVKLNDSWDYARLKRTTTQAGPTDTTYVAVQYNSQDELDTGSFAHSTSVNPENITLVTAGHYLVMANTYGTTGASTQRTVVQQKLTLDGSDIDGTLTTVMIRGTQSTTEGAASIGTIIETTSANMVLNVEVNRVAGTATITLNEDGGGTTVQRSAVTIVKLPDTADYIRLDDSGTDDMNPASWTAMGWNTEDELDTASFTHPVTDSRIEVDVADDYLFFTTLYSDTLLSGRGYYSQGWSKNGGTVITYGQTGKAARGVPPLDNSGNWSGFIAESLVATDYIEVETQQLAASGSVPANIKGVQGVRIGSLFE